MALPNSEYQLGLTNLNEGRVVDVVLAFVEHEELACPCDECILDIAALALNQTEPRLGGIGFGSGCAGTPGISQLVIVWGGWWEDSWLGVWVVGRSWVGKSLSSSLAQRSYMYY